METEPTEGWIENFWWIAAGDPPGTYEIDLRVEGQRVGVILSGGNIDMPRFCALLRAA